MKICILSNSHAASLKSALNKMSAEDLEGKEFAIVAAPNVGLKDLSLSDDHRRLTPRNKEIADYISRVSNGLREVEIASYDAFFLHGLDTIPPRIDRRHSTALRKLAVKDMLFNCIAKSISKMLCRATDTEVWISPEPLPADIGEDVKRQSIDAPTEPVRYSEVCDLIENEFSHPNIRWLWQDKSTIGEQLNTLQEYSVGSVRLMAEQSGVKHHSTDIRHMNENYGRIVLLNLIKGLKVHNGTNK